MLLRGAGMDITLSLRHGEMEGMGKFTVLSVNDVDTVAIASLDGEDFFIHRRSRDLANGDCGLLHREGELVGCKIHCERPPDGISPLDLELWRLEQLLGEISLPNLLLGE
jgi:hypothetical protein